MVRDERQAEEQRVFDIIHATVMGHIKRTRPLLTSNIALLCDERHQWEGARQIVQRNEPHCVDDWVLQWMRAHLFPQRPCPYKRPGVRPS